MSVKKGKSICLFSAKGGVGKSITAVNLAGVFAMQNKKVLIIDYDLSFGIIGSILNTPYEKTIYNFSDDYSNKRYKDIKDYYVKYNDNIYFISSPKDPRQASRISSSYIEFLLEKALFDFDVVIVDTNNELGEKNLFLLDIVDSILLVMNNDLGNIKNMRNLIKIFNDAGKTNYKVLLNDSINPYKEYFSLYDIKKMIDNNVDYYIPNNFFIKDLDSYIYDGKIVTLDKKFLRFYPKVNKTYVTILNDLEGESK